MPCNEAAVLSEQLTAIDAAYDNAVGDYRAGAVGKGFSIVGFFGAPEFGSGCRIDGHDGGVIGRQEQSVLPECDIAGGSTKHL